MLKKKEKNVFVYFLKNLHVKSFCNQYEKKMRLKRQVVKYPSFEQTKLSKLATGWNKTSNENYEFVSRP